MTFPCLTPRLVGLVVVSSALLVVGACGRAQDQPASTGGSGSEDESATAGETDEDSGIELPDDTSGTVDGAGGAAPDTSVIANCARTEVTAVDTTIAQPVDIIMLVDSSPSMLDEIGFVREHLNAFSQQIIESGVDARVIMIAEPIPEELPEDMSDTGICIDPPLGSGSCPDDTLLPNYVHLPQTVASSDSLDVLMRTSVEWKALLRPDSIISLFIVSDDEARYPRSIIYGDPPLWEDIDFMSNRFFDDFSGVARGVMHNTWSMNAVYPFSVCVDGERASSMYPRLVEMTNGIAGDLCEQDFQPVFDRLAARVVDDAVSLACEWELPAPIAGQTFSTQLVQVTRTSAGVAQELFQVPSEADCGALAWYFDDPTNPQRILACPETCNAIRGDTQGKIEVTFDCEIVEGCSASGAGSLARVPAGAEDEQGEPVACQWLLPQEPDADSTVDLESLNVRYVTQNGFGVLLGQVENAEACALVEQGWYYDTAQTPTLIVACPSTCETLQVAEVVEVEALFGCETKSALIR